MDFIGRGTFTLGVCPFIESFTASEVIIWAGLRFFRDRLAGQPNSGLESQGRGALNGMAGVPWSGLGTNVVILLSSLTGGVIFSDGLLE